MKEFRIWYCVEGCGWTHAYLSASSVEEAENIAAALLEKYSEAVEKFGLRIMKIESEDNRFRFLDVLKNIQSNCNK